MINNNKPVGPNNDWMDSARQSVKDAAKKVSGPMPMHEGVKETLRDVSEQASRTADSVIEGAKALFRSETAETISKKMNIFGSDTNPVELVENIRQAEGIDQAKLLLGFQKELEDMSSKQLDAAMKHIVTEMADEHNSDDPLLGALAKSVMQESSSRGVKTLPQPHWPMPRPLPISPEVMPFTDKNVLKKLDGIMFD